MTKLGLKECIPAMCTLDYDMAELGNTVFTREYTLAGGGAIGTQIETSLSELSKVIRFSTADLIK